MTDAVIVAVSGGKDSVVTLDLCAQHFKHIEAFFMYYVKGLSFQERWLNYAEAKYGIKIMRLPHFEVSEWIHFGSFRQQQPETPVIKIQDIYAYVRQETGLHWIAAGERISDSIWRRAMIKQSGLIDHNRGRLYPIGGWSKAQIISYIKAHRLRVSEESQTLGFSFRSFMPHDLLKIRTAYPEDYAKIVAQFPFVDANIKQLEFFGSE